jgi:hypothetical protein
VLGGPIRSDIELVRAFRDGRCSCAHMLDCVGPVHLLEHRVRGWHAVVSRLLGKRRQAYSADRTSPKVL